MAHAKEKIENVEYERLRNEFENLRSDFLSLTRELRSYARHEERALAEKANDRVVALKSAGEQQLDLAREYVIEGAETAENMVREHPAYAVAGATALGFLLGAFTARRRR